VLGAEVTVTARVTKLGRQLAFLEVDLTVGDATDPAAHASAVYAFPA
jgi:acyl-coenzyme A thioesterase PaaI-like protein